MASATSASSFSATFSCSFKSRRTLSMTLQTRSMCHCSSNSASSSSASLTTSLTRIFCSRSLSPRLRISSIATEEFSTTCSTRRSPSSIRLAISTSPSRVSSETAPILRRYMRTGIDGRGVAVGVLFFLGLFLLRRDLLVFVLVGRGFVRRLRGTLTFDDESTISMPSPENADSQSSI